MLRKVREVTEDPRWHEFEQVSGEKILLNLNDIMLFRGYFRYKDKSRNTILTLWEGEDRMHCQIKETYEKVFNLLFPEDRKMTLSLTRVPKKIIGDPNDYRTDLVVKLEPSHFIKMPNNLPEVFEDGEYLIDIPVTNGCLYFLVDAKRDPADDYKIHWKLIEVYYDDTEDTGYLYEITNVVRIRYFDSRYHIDTEDITLDDLHALFPPFTFESIVGRIDMELERLIPEYVKPDWRDAEDRHPAAWEGTWDHLSKLENE